jgi:hypothetical protein
MKITWGHKIAGVYLLFVAGILFLVIKANNERYDMVTKDYYGEELKYQQVIDQSANANALSSAVEVEKINDALTIRFPEEMRHKRIDVDFYLYCPADDTRDFRKNFTINEPAFTQVLPKGFGGYFELKLSWSADGKKYYNERKIFL